MVVKSGGLKRGQVAMEFLMTYGWAIIIILLAIAALWLLGVFSPSVTTTCQIEAPFTCQDAIVADNSVILRLGANQVQTATVNSVTVNGQACPELLGTQLTSNQITTVRCSGLSLDENEKMTVQIDATYEKKGGGLTHSVEGTVSGQASKGNYVYSSDSALVAAYDYEGDVIDVTVNGNDGTINGADCDVEGYRGKGCSFDGIDDFINLGDPVDGSFDFTGDFTLEAWVYLDQLKNDNVVFEKQPNSRNAYEYTINGNGDVRYDASGCAQAYTLSSKFTVGSWQHLAIVVNYGSTTTIYRNGVNVGSTTGCTTPGANSDPLGIGGASSLGTPYGGWFDGIIDDVAIWNRALTPQEVKEHADL